VKIDESHQQRCGKQGFCRHQVGIFLVKIEPPEFNLRPFNVNAQALNLNVGGGGGHVDPGPGPIGQPALSSE